MKMKTEEIMLILFHLNLRYLNEQTRAMWEIIQNTFWGLEAKVNIAWSSDIDTRTIIEIV
jgi:hypothetical protein